MNVVLLAGGVGGAKLADGLVRVLAPERLTIIVNTGDDFQHLGLTVCPDLDTVMYMLGGVASVETGWGRTEESWRTIEEVERLGGPKWFRLGDLDMATHLLRTQWLADGATLTAVTRRLCEGFGVRPAILPMSDQVAPTYVETKDGVLPFQVWFVRERWQPAVGHVILPEDVRATSAVVRALEAADVVILAPSNPFVSIDPILNVYPIRALIEDVSQAVVAVSPIIAGRAVKGPAAKMMGEMGMPASAAAIAGYYGHLVDGFVFDAADAGMAAEDGLALLCTDTMMSDPASRMRLAEEIVRFAAQLLSQT